jgi:hypothetical protein
MRIASRRLRARHQDRVGAGGHRDMRHVCAVRIGYRQGRPGSSAGIEEADGELAEGVLVSRISLPTVLRNIYEGDLTR